MGQKQVTGRTCISGSGCHIPGLDTIAANVLLLNLPFYFDFSSLGGGPCFWEKKTLQSYKKVHKEKWALIPTTDRSRFLRVHWTFHTVLPFVWQWQTPQSALSLFFTSGYVWKIVQHLHPEVSFTVCRTFHSVGEPLFINQSPLDKC